MTNHKELLRDIGLGIVVVGIVLVAFKLLVPSSTHLFGANECATGQTCLPSLELTGPNSGVTNGLQVDSGATTLAGSLAVTGLASFTATTTLNSTLNITTSNTATSTAIFGCWQSYATSTATTLRLEFTASTTAPTNGSGIIPVISYGKCPRI